MRSSVSKNILYYWFMKNLIYFVTTFTVVILGVITTGFAFTISKIQSTIIKIDFVFMGAVTSPLLGVYTLGIFFPWCTSLVSEDLCGRKLKLRKK